MRLLKRYSNRRLYDTETSRTLTQGDLARIIKKGVEVKVVDTVTGEDITLEVLGRVMIQEAATWKSGRDAKKLMSKIIQLGGTKSMSILRNTVLASIGAFHVTKIKAEKIIDHLIKEGELKPSDRKKAVLELLDKAEKSTAGWRKKISKEAARAQEEVTKIAKELKKYKMAKETDLKGLEKKVDKLSKSMKSLDKRLSEL